MADADQDRLRDFVAQFRVDAGSKVRLGRDFDPAATAGVEESEAEDLLREGVEDLSKLQERLAAQDTQALLVIIQAIDAAGKDGTIRHVMSGVNPQGVNVTSFKVPSDEENDHDFLWRYHKALPARGMIGIFNRSYYEELLVVRVHPAILAGQKLPPDRKNDGIWGRRFAQINDFESYLVDQGTTIVKLFLNLSKEEQRERFIARIDEPDKNWKFAAGDVKERAFWDDYQRAFEAVLTESSTKAAPWYVIPADHKWYARIAAARIIANALVEMDPAYPTTDPEERVALLAARAELVAEGGPAAGDDAKPSSKGKGRPKGTPKGRPKGKPKGRGSSSSTASNASTGKPTGA